MFLLGRHLPLRARGLSQRGASLMLAAAAFGAGLSTGSWLERDRAHTNADQPATTAVHRADDRLTSGYRADVLRVLDGDTFEARVRIWPNQDVTTKVRLRGIDAPEMKARCDTERVKALASRDFLARLLAEGAVTISDVGLDKYGGRIDAEVATSRTTDVSSAMLAAEHARFYDGGKRRSWCD